MNLKLPFPMPTDPNHSPDGVTLRADASRPPAAPLQGTETSPQEIERKYQKLVEGIGGDYILYTHLPDGTLTYLSPSVEQVLGYPVEAVIGINWRELIGEQHLGRELAERVEREVAEGKDFYNFTVEVSHADGSTRLMEIQQRPFFDEEGQFCSIEGVAKDVTELRRNAEELERLKNDLEQRVAERTTELIRSNERLQASEARYRTVVDCQTDFVVRWMPGAIFTFVNEAFCKLLNRSHEQIVGWCFLPLVHAEDRPTFDEMAASLNRENPHRDFQCRMVLPDGRMLWSHWTNQMLFDDQGQFLEYQSVGRDTTALKKAADTIREKEAHLAHVSRLATMGELVAGMAHEINQPLHAAKTFAGAARRNLEASLACGSPQAQQLVETAMDCTREISSAISRTAEIIHRLRDFTYFRPVKTETLRLNQVVQEAGELIAFETRKAHVQLRYNLDPNVPDILGDQIQLQQVCVNLLINAYEAMTETPREKRRVVIQTRLQGNAVELCFKDAGCGIDEGVQGKLFDAFYSTKQQGMGMGLSLCKSIAEAHGGSIRAEQNQDQGMTFTLEIPLPSQPPHHERMDG
jgi:PAS domain S-box-containing protein